MCFLLPCVCHALSTYLEAGGVWQEGTSQGVGAVSWGQPGLSLRKGNI